MLKFTANHSLDRQAGDKDRTFDLPNFEKLTTNIEANSSYINAISSRLILDEQLNSEENEHSNVTLEPP